MGLSDGAFFMIKHTPLPNGNQPISSPICPIGVADTLGQCTVEFSQPSIGDVSRDTISSFKVKVLAYFYGLSWYCLQISSAPKVHRGHLYITSAHFCTFSDPHCCVNGL